MARIRSVKPETWVSETLAEVSIPAMLTFLGMTNHADDHGRHRDNAAIVYGLIWPMRDEISRADVEDHLQQLASVGAICRYTGCDGRRYFHYPTWHKHQKIDKPSLSRLPACPHCEPERCGVCKGPCIQRAALADTTGNTADDVASAPRVFAETSANTPAGLDQRSEPSLAPPAPTASLAPAAVASAVDADCMLVPETRKTAGQTAFVEDSPRVRRTLPEGSAPGSRILDPGSSFPTGRQAPDADTVSASQLIGEYVAACAERPPGSVLGHLGKVVKTLLAEGIPADHVRAGLRRYAEIQGHPSRLPSLVNDAMNARGAGLARPRFRHNVPAHQAWTNPVDAVAAYAEEL
ncbi:hypothetical protein E6W39_06790 [Kitasatospora acidiphila]|uniref:Uncharacterized protein n=1 Tax=Kitasatospora acidiphila TaxID=2567942 RepID=A0A540VZ47_9ACTN|nr:hypothetical protein [Kitasatospora acidiphila]TQF02038.1 hypothetical protein E6W39_06790 [Kitasatospora acidiphila]